MKIEATKIADSEVIEADGIYDMSMDWYHSQCCAGPSFSSSGLRTIYHQSPADFWAFSDLNDNRYEKDTKDAFTYGRAAHSLILGDEVFADKFAVIPKDAPPKPLASQIAAREMGRVSASAQERFDFWDIFDVDNAGKEYISENDVLHIANIADQLAASPIATILLQGAVEHSMIWKDEKTGLWIKSRLDVLSVTGDWADLKTTVQTDVPKLLRDVRLRGYDMQMGLATMGAEHLLGVDFNAENYESRSAILIFVSKSPPYHVMPVELDYGALYWGRIKCRAALNRALDCIKSGHWPGPVEGIETYTSGWEEEKLLEQQAAGLLPHSA